MRIVIDISEDLYEGIERRDEALETEYVCDELMKAVDNGMLLPKGHGRLIDADELKKIINENDALSMAGFNVRLCDINNTPTIIEADKEVQE